MLFFLYVVLPIITITAAIIYAVLYNSKEDGLEIRAFWLRKHINRFYKTKSKGKCVQYTYSLSKYERKEVLEDAISTFHTILAENKFNKTTATYLKRCADLIAKIKQYDDTEKEWKNHA